MTLLQWGLGLSTEEGLRSMWPPSPGSHRFNGASVFQPRKVDKLKPDDLLVLLLQWGLGLSTEEGNINAAATAAGVDRLQWGLGLSTEEGGGTEVWTNKQYIASMGPRSFNRGRS